MKYQVGYYYFIKKENKVYVTFIEDKGNYIDVFNYSGDDFQEFKKVCENY